MGQRVIIIAGPNGAGKTTFAREYLPQEADCPVYINADLIAEGLSPFDPVPAALRAGKLMLEEIDHNVRLGKNFAFETTLAGLLYAKRISDWRERGYTVKLLFLMLPTVEEAIERVRSRVEHGGHSVPEPTIRRRFHRGLANFRDVYQNRVDYWQLIDNSGPQPVLIEEGPEN